MMMKNDLATQTPKNKIMYGTGTIIIDPSDETLNQSPWCSQYEFAFEINID